MTHAVHNRYEFIEAIGKILFGTRHKLSITPHGYFDRDLNRVFDGYKLQVRWDVELYIIHIPERTTLEIIGQIYTYKTLLVIDLAHPKSLTRAFLRQKIKDAIKVFVDIRHKSYSN